MEGVNREKNYLELSVSEDSSLTLSTRHILTVKTKTVIDNYLHTLEVRQKKHNIYYINMSTYNMMYHSTLKIK